MLVGRVAIKSMDSRGNGGRTSVRQRSGQRLYGNWLVMLPCPRIWNIWCYFHVQMYDFGRRGGHQIDGFSGGVGTDFGATAVWSEIECKLLGNATLPYNL